MSFQLESGEAIGKCMELERFQENVLAFHAERETIVNI